MVMKSVAGGLPDFAPFVHFSAFSTYGIKAVIVMMGNEYRDQFLIKHECIKRLVRRFRQEGISLARPVGALLGDAHDQFAPLKEDAAKMLE